MSIKDALVNVVDVLHEDHQKTLLLTATKMLQSHYVGNPEVGHSQVEDIKPTLIKDPVETKKRVGIRSKVKSTKKLKKGPFRVQGEEYPSARQVAETFSLDYPKLLRRIKKGNLSLDEIVVSLAPSKSKLMSTGGIIKVRKRTVDNNVSEPVSEHVSSHT